MGMNFLLFIQNNYTEDNHPVPPSLAVTFKCLPIYIDTCPYNRMLESTITDLSLSCTTPLLFTVYKCIL